MPRFHLNSKEKLDVYSITATGLGSIRKFLSEFVWCKVTPKVTQIYFPVLIIRHKTDRHQTHFSFTLIEDLAKHLLVLKVVGYPENVDTILKFWVYHELQSWILVSAEFMWKALPPLFDKIWQKYEGAIRSCSWERCSFLLADVNIFKDLLV